MPEPNGYVPTPDPVATLVAAEAFAAERPSERPGGGRVLLPGLGDGQLFRGIERYCEGTVGWCGPAESYPRPECIGVENDLRRIRSFNAAHPDADVDVRASDFLLEPPSGSFDWVVANPPYCRYKSIPDRKRQLYRQRFDVCEGQFTLFAPFVAQSMRLLRPGGWATFVLPVSPLWTGVAEPLRDIFRGHFTGLIALLPEAAFDQQVRTILVSVKKEWSESSPRNLWLEALRRPQVDALLSRLGVADVQRAADQYFQRVKDGRDRVRHVDRRERNQRDGFQYRPEVQSSLARFVPEH